jgi:hypothetical protein
MWAMADLKEVPKATPEDYDGFEQKTVTIKGTDYTFRELSTGEYDDAIQKSTDKAADGPDSVKLLRWMIIMGSVEPKLTSGSLAKLPMSTTGKISDAVNELHFGPPDLTPFADRLTAAGWTVTPPEAEDDPKD